MLYKTLVVLSIIAVFAGALFTTNGPSQPFSPQPPVFNNPFANDYTYTLKTPTQPFWWNATSWDLFQTYGTAHNCSYSMRGEWNCLSDPDGQDYNATYVILPRADQLFLNLTGFPAKGLLTGGTVTIWCRRTASGTPSPMVINVRWPTISWEDTQAPGGTPLILANSYNSQSGNCPKDSFGPVTLTLQTIGLGGGFPGDPFAMSLINFAIGNIRIDIGTPGDQGVDITFVSVEWTVNNSETYCGGTAGFANIGCQLVLFLRPIILFINFVVNGVIWFFVWIGVIIQTISNYVAVIIWLYNIPGVPGVIQAYIDAVLTAWILVLTFEIYKIIKIGG